MKIMQFKASETLSECTREFTTLTLRGIHSINSRDYITMKINSSSLCKIFVLFPDWVTGPGFSEMGSLYAISTLFQSSKQILLKVGYHTNSPEVMTAYCHRRLHGSCMWWTCQNKQTKSRAEKWHLGHLWLPIMNSAMWFLKEYLPLIIPYSYLPQTCFIFIVFWRFTVKNEQGVRK